MKKILLFLLSFVCLFALVACSSKEDPKPTPDPTPDPDNTELDKIVSDNFKGIASGKKIYLTTCGQSDVGVVELLLEDMIDDNQDAIKANFGGKSTVEEVVTRVDDLKAENVEEGSMLIVVVGGSNKGLGAAGTNVSDETKRASDFAKLKGKVTLVVVHIGKQARRGDTSDPIIRAIAPSADLIMVAVDGDFDGYFTGVAESNKIEYHQYSLIPKLTPSFLKMFCK